MEKEFDFLVETLKKLDGFVLLEASLEATWIHFRLTSQDGITLLSNQVNEIKEQYLCNLLVLTNQNDPSDFTYQLTIESENRFEAIKALSKKLISVLEINNDERKAKFKELGLPDLSLVTIRQLASELKSRPNLTFALVWIENSARDNIAIEGSGNPTQLVGLLSRGNHMAIEWADKNIKFYRNDDE